MTLAEARKRKNMSREELAAIMGITLMTLIAYENGEERIDPATANDLSDILDIEPDELDEFEDFIGTEEFGMF